MYHLVAVEQNEDGSWQDVTPEDAANMKLPFHYGWHHWTIVQAGKRIMSSHSFTQARSTCQALNILP